MNGTQAIFTPNDETRLTSRDVRTLLLWVLVGLAGAFVGFKYFFAAFPEAAVDFRVSRGDAQQAAKSFLENLGYRVDGYQSTIVFAVDDNADFSGGAKTYLEREVGLEQANRLMAGEVSVWYWDVRFFRPLQKEEFGMHISPAGRVVGMRHVIEEAREGARLDAGAARALAEAFLRERVKAPLEGYDFLPEEANSTDRDNRRDWSFTWERRGFKAKDATYRMRVAVQGDTVGGYREFLKVPEEWTLEFQKLRSSNIFWQYVALLPYILLTGAALLVLFEFARQGRIRWGGFLKLAVIAAVLVMLSGINDWPITRAGYDTNTSYSGFIVLQMGVVLLFALGVLVTTVLPLAAGEPVYRTDQPNQLRMAAPFSRSWRSALGSKDLFRSCVIGLSLAAAHIGFVVAFYLIGSRFGVWAPQDINYTEAVSTALPWIYPLAISLYAATSEEFLFRLFAIPYLLRLTKSRFIAVVIPALVWGFLHSAYPQQPGYIRGIEVGFIGIVAGWVMLRWGILATLVWHYTVDALLIGLFLLRSESLYFRLSGGFVVAMVLFPLLAASAMFLVRRRFVAEESLFNRSDPLSPAREEPAAPAAVARPARAYAPLSARTLWLVLGIGAVGYAAVFGFRPERVADFVEFKIDAREAGERADEILSEQKVDLSKFRRAVVMEDTTSGVVNEFLRRESGIAAINRLYREKVPPALWVARYFQDGKKEEYAVYLALDGTLHSVRHTLDEKTPGANLTKEEAQARVEVWLRDTKKLDLQQWKLVDAQSKKHPARTDHVFVWEEQVPAVEKNNSGAADAPADETAHVRVSTSVLGDEVSNFIAFVKIPENWEREHTRQGLASIAYLSGRVLLLLVLVGLILVLFFMNLKQQRVPWGRVSLWALWGALALVVGLGIAWPRLLFTYSTQFPFSTYLMILVIGQFIVVATLYSGIFLALAFGWFFFARAFGEEHIPGWRGMPASYYRDAVCLAVGGAGGLALLGRLPTVAERFWQTPRFATGSAIPAGWDTLLPAAGEVAGSVTQGLGTIGFLAVLAGFLTVLSRTGMKRWGGGEQASATQSRLWVPALALLLIGLAMVGQRGSAEDFAKHALLIAATYAVYWLAVARVFRNNMLGYFLMFVVAELVPASAALLRQPNDFLRWNGYLMVAALILFLGVALAGWLRGRSGSALPLEPPVSPTP